MICLVPRHFTGCPLQGNITENGELGEKKFQQGKIREFGKNGLNKGKVRELYKNVSGGGGGGGEISGNVQPVP